MQAEFDKKQDEFYANIARLNEAPEAEAPEPAPAALDKFCYFDNGVSLKMVASDYEPAEGEQVFSAAQTRKKLLAAFPNFPKPDVICYSNNGMGMRYVPADYSAAVDEAVFEAEATPEQLAAAFPNYKTKAAQEEIAAQIADLEAMQTPRRIREAVAGTDNGWLTALNNKIAALRAKL